MSARTARRDLEGLAMAGIPVYSQPGRGGGWTLIGGSRTDLSGLTAAEARTLFLVAGPSAATPAGEDGLAQAGPGASLHLPLRRRGGRRCRRARPDELGPRRSLAPPRHLERCSRRSSTPCRSGWATTRRDGEVSERVVHPLGLVVKNQVWYLIAADRRRPADLPGQPRAGRWSPPMSRCDGPRTSISPRPGAPS